MVASRNIMMTWISSSATLLRAVLVGCLLLCLAFDFRAGVSFAQLGFLESPCGERAPDEDETRDEDGIKVSLHDPRRASRCRTMAAPHSHSPKQSKWLSPQRHVCQSSTYSESLNSGTRLPLRC